jgi:hypothetical protein
MGISCPRKAVIFPLPPLLTVMEKYKIAVITPSLSLALVTVAIPPD